MEKIREYTEKLAEGVEASAKQYAAVDGALSRAFGEMEATFEGPQASPAGEVPGGGLRR